MALQVPRGMLATTGPGAARTAEERRILSSYFPRFGWDGDDAVGTLTTYKNNDYRIRIVLPATYPLAMPDIHPDGWQPQSNPHLYLGPTRLCVMRSSQWVSYLTVAVTVTKAAVWLNKYEVWVEKHYWPGREQHTNDPVTAIRKIWHERFH